MSPHSTSRPWPALQRGDTVALFSPGSHAGRQPPGYLQAALEDLRGLGLSPLEPRQPRPRHLYMAGTDAERAEEFTRLYCDPAVRALFATRGGYGTARMLPLLDAKRIAVAPPKPVVGMSDITALFGYLEAIASVGGVHGPCLAAPSFRESSEAERNLADLACVLFRERPPGPLPCEILHWPESTTEAQGRLQGGCLAVLAAGMGSAWAARGEGALLFLEDVGEAPYRIDRYLTQLRQSGVFEGVSAIAFGYLADCEGPHPGLLPQVLRDVLSGLPCPVVTGIEAGHGARNHTLPLGCGVHLKRTGETAAQLEFQTS